MPIDFMGRYQSRRFSGDIDGGLRRYMQHCKLPVYMSGGRWPAALFLEVIEQRRELLAVECIELSAAPGGELDTKARPRQCSLERHERGGHRPGW
ncbi:MAG: hypothetical protein AAGC55_02540 [Myxococcota bacterium]